ncbi:hypothetical protein [Piscibacillus salipiscarius]|uniref:Uncharacterized protein n=1 Tax=Piscibacillus salipiscarius TaxID=299480 RepID=A0ABW5Q8Q1_9BACI|nr:hypothetical protein [Piscibacillus salipiscarius]
MSWKSVEMQVALPRVVDAAHLQEQYNQRGQTLQTHLAQTNQSEELLRRKQVQKTNSDNSASNDLNRHNKQQENIQLGTHPFLGKLYDLKG